MGKKKGRTVCSSLDEWAPSAQAAEPFPEEAAVDEEIFAVRSPRLPEDAPVVEPTVEDLGLDEPPPEEPLIDEPSLDEPLLYEPPPDEPAPDELPLDEPVVDHGVAADEGSAGNDTRSFASESISLLRINPRQGQVSSSTSETTISR